MPRRDDWLLGQLPMGMLEDDFFARFVGIFQEVATTYLDGVDNLENVVDVTVAPESVVRWLGGGWGSTPSTRRCRTSCSAASCANRGRSSPGAAPVAG